MFGPYNFVYICMYWKFIYSYSPHVVKEGCVQSQKLNHLNVWQESADLGEGGVICTQCQKGAAQKEQTTIYS